MAGNSFDLFVKEICEQKYLLIKKDPSVIDYFTLYGYHFPPFYYQQIK